MTQEIRLRTHGDFYEQVGSRHYNIDGDFPLYEEFWIRYIVPKRDPRSAAFLADVPPELEYLFMAHYSVWYHLTVAHRQIHKLAFFPEEQEYSEPLFHLSSAADAAHVTLALVYLIRNDFQKVEGLVAKQFDKKMNFWKPKSLEALNEYATRNDPFSIVLEVAEGVEEKVRKYRNVVTHTPILSRVAGKVPRADKLTKYRLWSAVLDAPDDELQKDFETAHVLFKELARDLVWVFNMVWYYLLEEMKQVVDAQYSQLYIEKPDQKEATSSYPLLINSGYHYVATHDLTLSASGLGLISERAYVESGQTPPSVEEKYNVGYVRTAQSRAVEHVGSEERTDAEDSDSEDEPEDQS